MPSTQAVAHVLVERDFRPVQVELGHPRGDGRFHLSTVLLCDGLPQAALPVRPGEREKVINISADGRRGARCERRPGPDTPSILKSHRACTKGDRSAPLQDHGV